MTIHHLLDKVFHRHSKELLIFASQRAGNAAEDVVQETYLRLLQHPDPESIGNIRAYLYRITANLCVDLHRKRVSEARYEVEATDDVEREVVKVAATEPTPELQFSHEQAMDRLRDMLQALPEMTRYVFVLKRIEGLSHAEIANRLGISVRHSERRYSAALRHLLNHPEFEG